MPYTVTKHFSFVPAATIEKLGFSLEPLGSPTEVGVSFVTDSETGEPFTIIGDAAMVRMIRDAIAAGVTEGLEIPTEGLVLEGWPEGMVGEMVDAELQTKSGARSGFPKQAPDVQCKWSG